MSIMFLKKSFYVAAPMSLCCSLFPVVLNYTIRGRMDLAEFRDYLKPLPQLGWYQWIGTAIFMWGWIHQLRCHAILVGLNLYGLNHTLTLV